MSRFDIVVIGGGPAGMMAAARAAQYGARTVLIEKNKELGRKLMITGRGRCNFAHDEDDPEVLAQAYRHGGEFLLRSLRKFGTKETLAFFLRRGIVPAHERGHRIYPKEGFDASSVVSALWTALKDSNVQVLRGEEVKSFDFLGGKARRVITVREEIEGSAFIIATGGLSFPYTGSTGDGYRWARKAGHELTPPEPALCPVKVAERFDSNMSGLKLKNVRVTLQQDGQTVDERFGEMDFTPFGISGAIIMDMASSINSCLKNSSNVTIHIDLKPALEPERLDARISRDFTEFFADPLRFALRKLLPAELIPEVIKKAALDMGKPCGETTPEERAALRSTLKDFKLTPTQLLGFHHAIVTSGGIRTEELDPETMGSKLIPNLYFAGEVIDIDGPTGGYNLQECWSTGFAAGSAAAEALGFSKPTEEQILKQMVQGNERRIMQNTLEKQKRKAESNEKERTEEMTIKTGPVDNQEFCGWRDPRKKDDAAEEEKEQFAGKRFSEMHDVPFRHDSRSKRSSAESSRQPFPDEDEDHSSLSAIKENRRKYGRERFFNKQDMHSRYFEKTKSEDKRRLPERHESNEAWHRPGYSYEMTPDGDEKRDSVRHTNHILHGRISRYDNESHRYENIAQDRPYRKRREFDDERSFTPDRPGRQESNSREYWDRITTKHGQKGHTPAPRYSENDVADSHKTRPYQRVIENSRHEDMAESVHGERRPRYYQNEEHNTFSNGKRHHFSNQRNDENDTRFDHRRSEWKRYNSDTSVTGGKQRRRFTDFKRFRNDGE